MLQNKCYHEFLPSKLVFPPHAQLAFPSVCVGVSIGMCRRFHRYVSALLYVYQVEDSGHIARGDEPTAPTVCMSRSSRVSKHI